MKMRLSLMVVGLAMSFCGCSYVPLSEQQTIAQSETTNTRGKSGPCPDDFQLQMDAHQLASQLGDPTEDNCWRKIHTDSTTTLSRDYERGRVVFTYVLDLYAQLYWRFQSYKILSLPIVEDTTPMKSSSTWPPPLSIFDFSVEGIETANRWMIQDEEFLDYAEEQLKTSAPIRTEIVKTTIAHKTYVVEFPNHEKGIWKTFNNPPFALLEQLAYELDRDILKFNIVPATRVIQETQYNEAGILTKWIPGFVIDYQNNMAEISSGFGPTAGFNLLSATKDYDQLANLVVNSEWGKK